MRYFLLTHPLILSFYYFVFCFIFIYICYYCYYYYYYYYIILYYIFFIISSLLSLLFLHLPSPKEENVAIYGRYIVYREESTRYFVEKNRKEDISVNIAKISAIYRRYIGDFVKKSPLVAINRRYIGDKSEIYRRFFGDISPHSCGVIWRLRLRPCWSNGPDAILTAI